METEKKTEETKMSINKYGREVTWNCKSMDVDVDSLVEGFYGLLVSLTYHPYSILNAMRNFVDEQSTLLDLYDKKYEEEEK